MGVKVHIEYCGAWGYGFRFRNLEKKIHEKVPDAEVIGEKGRKASFEIQINGVPEYSKLETGGFPDYQDVVKAVDGAKRGEKHLIMKSTSLSCNIL